MRYAKILENGSLEYAPRNIDGVSNWIEDVDAVKAAGYLPVHDSFLTPEGKVFSGWENVDDVICPVFSEEPGATDEEKKQIVRQVRNDYINKLTWRIERYREQIALSNETTDDGELIQKILEYRQYLRDYPGSSATWFEQLPQTFEDWLEVHSVSSENNTDNSLSVEPENRAQSNEVEDEE